MPSFQYDGVTLYYEEYGQGFPLLAFSPGGLTATIDWWEHRAAPIDVRKVFSDEYRVVVMDQRNAGGRSEGPISAADDWTTYMHDHLALIDHLGIQRCHLYGQCIGGPFVLSLLREQPERFPCAVLAQPIGRLGPMPETKSDSFLTWANQLKGRPGVNDAVIESVYRNLYASGFGYSVDREFAAHCQTPAIVFPGNDEAHPYAYADELAGLLPNATFIPEWKTGAALESATENIRAFLRQQTPVVA